MGLPRTIGVVAILAVCTLFLAPVQMIAARLNWPLMTSLPFHWQRLARWLIRLRVRVEGEPAKPPLLITANHISWLDVTVLGGVLPVSFVAKAEIAKWPVLGTLARLQRTIFIDRNRRSQTGVATEAIAQRVGSGDVMVLFAEGTTGDGNRILPFRSALIGAASAVAGMKTMTVQPVAITYARIQGIPVGAADRPALAWYGDMDFIAHFRRLLEWGAIDAVVSFGEPILIGPDTDRKKVAEQCHVAVRKMLESARQQPSWNGSGGRVFSPQQKEAKATANPPAGPYAGPQGEGIVNRPS
jgi:lyso-ornithine lipid O-acyltransferase